ncbi:MAG: methyltransferase domain-containing protein [Nanoarchaeota archaeon]
MKNNIHSYDILGNIALVRFPEDFKQKEKKKFAEKILEEQKGIRTVLEKIGKIKGRLRKLSTKFVAGENTKEVLYKENGCVFRFNIDKTYFSPRLSNERKEIASMIRKGENVLVMFAGVAPFSIVIAKNSLAKKVYSNEINREANKYAELNIKLNKLKDKIELVNGDAKKLPEKLKQRFDVIVMPRPQLKDSFLKQAFSLSKKGTRIYYYDFCKENEIDSIVEMIKKEASNAKKKINILKVKRAGELSPSKIRLRVDFQIL